MLDKKELRNNFAEIKARLKFRNPPSDLDLWPALDENRRAALQEIEGIRAEKNSFGPQIAKAKKEGKSTEEIQAKLKETGEREKTLEALLSEIDQRQSAIELIIPNVTHENVPEGPDESHNREEKKWGALRKFEFEPKPHWEIGENLGILDFERAAKLSGARFSLLYDNGALLERALASYMLDRHRKRGYREVMPPLLVRYEAMVGSGQFPKFEEQAFSTNTVEPRLFLIPTSEVPLCNLHAGEILAADKLPLYYTAFTPCFRAEAGSHGRDVRGLIRLHQFNKVELVKMCTPETSFEEHEKLTLDAEAILEELGLPYRRLTLCTGDTGIASAKTYDLEVWLPGQGGYREISSCSNICDYQSRRNDTKFRPAAGEKAQFVHMLNGSGLAVGRTMVAILENYQEADGSVTIPVPLRPFMGGLDKITAE